MIITKKVTRKKTQRNDDIVEYNIAYLTEKPQHYINKYIKVQPSISEPENFDNNKSSNYTNNSNMNPEYVEKTKEELIASINAMLKLERELLMKQAEMLRDENYSLTKRRF